jgi:hypothetical protein
MPSAVKICTDAADEKRIYFSKASQIIQALCNPYAGVLPQPSHQHRSVAQQTPSVGQAKK